MTIIGRTRPLGLKGRIGHRDFEDYIVNYSVKDGFEVHSHRTVKFRVEPDGDVFIGEDVSAAATTNLALFTTAQTYNSESVGAGDMLIGDNTASKANIYWDKSAGKLQFRGGTTMQAEIGTDGKLLAGGGNVTIDANGITLIPDSSLIATAQVKWKVASTTYFDIGVDTASNANIRVTDISGNLTFKVGANTPMQLLSTGATISALNVGTATGATTGDIYLSNLMQFFGIDTPDAPAANYLKFYARTVQGHTRPAYIDDDDIEIIIARDNFLIAKNTSGSTITKGQAVYVTGSTGNVPNIGLAKANSLTTLPAIGLAMSSIDNNAFGPVQMLGVLSSIDTSAFTTGDRLYVSEATAGALTATRPTHPNLVQRVGSVLVSGVGNGSINLTVAPFLGGEDTGTLNSFTVDLGLNVGSVDSAGTGDVRYSGDLESYRNATYYTGYAFVPLATPLTSTSWDGDSYSTTAKTLIDLSAVFTAPAGIKAILAYVSIRDSGSAAGDPYIILSPNDTASSGLAASCAGLTNDAYTRQVLTVPCDVNGDVYYQIAATGASTMDVYIQIWGYYL